MLSYQEELERVANEVDKFPLVFGMRAWPGDTFRLSPGASYWSPGFDNECGKQDPGVILYTQIKDGDEWHDFAKGTPEELRREIVVF